MPTTHHTLISIKYPPKFSSDIEIYVCSSCSALLNNHSKALFLKKPCTPLENYQFFPCNKESHKKVRKAYKKRMRRAKTKVLIVNTVLFAIFNRLRRRPPDKHTIKKSTQGTINKVWRSFRVKRRHLCTWGKQVSRHCSWGWEKHSKLENKQSHLWKYCRRNWTLARR